MEKAELAEAAECGPADRSGREAQKSARLRLRPDREDGQEWREDCRGTGRGVGRHLHLLHPWQLGRTRQGAER